MKIHVAMMSALLLAIPAAQAFAQTSGQSRQEQEQACQDDAFNFCQEAMPNEDRVLACLRKHHSKLSPACRKMISQPRRHRR
jgi:hypothetical protein